ncbi:MAG: hypothetical protein IAI49_04330 [Candidatus Eremiobacteraeota bacterium]|nr:hypothetical protein [Candidatus Eremiobacteraeota bacterium]
MIYGYASRMSVYPGERLELCVATAAPRFSVRIYRQGERFEAMPDGTFGAFEGVAAGPQSGGRHFDWQPYEIAIPRAWPPGCYVALFFAESEDGRPLGFVDDTTADGRDARALFVVRARPDAEPAPILFKLPTFTYQAYNVPDPACAAGERERRGDGSDGQTFYTGADVVSLQRNGCGTGGTPWDMFHAPDVYDRATPRQSFAHWDVKFIAWMERNGYRAEYCTDLDLHERPAEELLRHALFVSVGHDEYWSADMRRHLDEYVERGGNAAFFAGNLLWWRVRVFDENRSIARVSQFSDETMLTGVTFAHGGGWWVGERPAAGFTVREPSHWAFDGTGLRAGETFGARGRLIGYETDGQPFSWAALQRGGALVYDSSHRIPEGFELLGYADVRDWTMHPDHGEILGNGAGVLGVFRRGGTVFTAATTDWARVLAEGDPAVERITRNVLDRLSVAR